MLQTIWDKHDFLADLLETAPSIDSNIVSSHALTSDLQLTCAQILSNGLDQSVYDNILDPASRMKLADDRYFAWAAQAIFHGHACAVGQRIILGKDRSPLIEQLQANGSEPRDFDLRAFTVRSEACKKTLDVMIHEQSKYYEVILIQGYTFDAAKRVSPSIRISAGQQSLLSNRINYLEDAKARSYDVKALLLARDVIQTLFPNKTVTAIFMIVGGPNNLPHFQAFNLTTLREHEIKGDKLLLDNFEPCYTSLDERQDIEHIQQRMEQAVLGNPPFERAVRMSHLLRAFYDQQAANTRRLFTTTMTELGRRVSSKHDMHYEDNLLRHDYEDGLERRGYIRRIWMDGTKFALSPKGVGKASLLNRLHKAAQPHQAACVVKEVIAQANLLQETSVY